MNLSLKILYFKNYSNLENIIMNKFRLRKQYEEKSRHLLQAEARVARIQRELDAQKNIPESDADSRRKIKDLTRQVEDEKHANLQMQERLRLAEIAAIEGQAELIQGDHKSIDREIARLQAGYQRQSLLRISI